MGVEKVQMESQESALKGNLAHMKKIFQIILLIRMRRLFWIKSPILKLPQRYISPTPLECPQDYPVFSKKFPQKKMSKCATK